MFVILLRMVTKAAFTDSGNGLRISACIFFLASSILCFLCFIVQKCVIMHHPLIDDAPLSPETPLLDAALEDQSNKCFEFLPSEHRRVIKKLKVSIFSLVLIYFVTLTIFPGVPSDVEASFQY